MTNRRTVLRSGPVEVPAPADFGRLVSGQTIGKTLVALDGAG